MATDSNVSAWPNLKIQNNFRPHNLTASGPI